MKKRFKFLNSILLSIILISTPLVSVITENTFAGFVVGEAISNALNSVFNKLCEDNLKNYNNKMLIEDYNKTINENGYKTDFSNPIVLKVGIDNEIILESNIKYSAKATAIFGDRTKARIYANPALAKTESKVRKYVVI